MRNRRIVPGYAMIVGLTAGVLMAVGCDGYSEPTDEVSPAEKALPGIFDLFRSFCGCNGVLFVCGSGSCFCSGNSGYCRAAGTGSSSSGGGYPNCGPGAIDPDGDGWGWENNQSCRMAGGSGSGNQTGQSSSGSSGGYPNCGPSAIDPDGDGWGWENNKSCRVVGGGNTGSGNTGSGTTGSGTTGGGGKSTSITGRISMGTRDGNQCGIRYTGDERVGSSQMLITGVDTPTFGVWQNGIPSALCGRIANVYKNGQTYRFVIVDRIWENTSYAQLDVAKEFFYSTMGNNNWTANVEITSQVAPGITCDSWVFQHAASKSYCTNR